MRKKPLKTLTLRKLPEQVADAVRHRAEDNGWSFSKALISLLEEKVNRKTISQKPKRDLRFMRTWTDEEYEAFQGELADQRKIDPEMWK